VILCAARVVHFVVLVLVLFFAAVLWAVIDRIAVVPEEVYLEQKFGDRVLYLTATVLAWRELPSQSKR
jgi:protein-S-isoprenylcysteine O-methyltransferase Ste14